ncbi:alpha/beta hydrolase [Fulvivirgaceae bacterium BMA10]|uniref:Alpha/beta hydrolase n=1 Tax=Splendidivirga corallicola TaxID=3051826 RepID=A0ABT8KGL4_9BACT|nr:alpha/beta hydrolase [Fulvivirgaceae bacterium BMA10]
MSGSKSNDFIYPGKVGLGSAELHYQVMGKGNEALLAFHGFGQNSSHFSGFSNIVQGEYTVYSFDLFFHGMSNWPEKGTSLEKEQWKHLIINFLIKNKIEKFSLIGYSLGAKFVLATLEAFPDRIKQITLIAPDGIKTNFWYSLATYPVILRYWFKSFIKNPSPFFLFLKFMRALGFVDKGIARFASRQMDTEDKRKRVYLSWVIFRHLKFNMSDISGLINRQSVKLEMFLGKYDKIMTERNMARLLNKVEKYQLHILETGHNTLINDVANFYKGKKYK